MKYYEEIVKNRQSCRSFEDISVEFEKIEAITDYHEDEESDLVDEIKTELKFYGSKAYGLLKDSVGYNGICIKAPQYAVLYSEKADHYLENAGYIIQGITLKMTELGLAACWLTINDADAAKAALGEVWRSDTERKITKKKRLLRFHLMSSAWVRTLKRKLTPTSSIMNLRTV